MRFLGRQLRVPRLFRPRNATLTDAEFWREIFGAFTSAAGVKVTPLTALGVATVFACVNAISRSFATLPLKLYRKVPGGGREVAIEHPLYTLLHDAPNEEMTSADFRRAMQANATLRQQAFALIVRNALGEIAEIRPIANADIMPERDPAGQLRYRLKEEWIDASRILHIRGFTLNGVTGVDTIGTARECIGLAIALQDNAARFFGNGSRPGAILEYPGVLTSESAKRLRESFDNLYKGRENAWRTAVLEEGLKYVAQRTDNDSSQFNESRIQQGKEIAQIFGIPPHKVGILENATFSNIEEQSIEYVTDAILPWCTQWEQTLNQKLLTPEERRVYSFAFTLEGLLRGDIATRFAAYATARQWGWMNVDEIRERENLNPLPDGMGQIYLQPLNMGEPGSENQTTTQDLQKTSAARRARTKQKESAAA